MKSSKTLLAVIIFCLAPLSFLCGGEVVFIASSDLHGRIDHFSAVAPEIRKYPDAVKVDIGDFAQGYFPVFMQGGMPMIRAFNELGYSIIVPGNHELEFSETQMLEWQNSFRGVMLGAQWSYGKFQMPSCAVIERDGYRVGVIALGAAGLKYRAGVLPGLRYRDEVTAVQDAVKILQQQNCHAVILLCHASVENFSFTGKVLQENPEIDAVIGGHSHRAVPGGYVNGRLAAQPGAHGSSLLRMVLVFDDNKKLKYIHSNLLRPEKNSRGDAVLNNIVDECRQYSDLAGREELGYFDDHGDFGNYCAAVLMKVSGAQAAVFNYDIKHFSSRITPVSLFNIMPYGNRIAVVTLKREDALRLLDSRKRGGIRYFGAGDFSGEYVRVAMPDYLFFRERGWADVPVVIKDVFVLQEIINDLKSKEYREKKSYKVEKSTSSTKL